MTEEAKPEPVVEQPKVVETPKVADAGAASSVGSASYLDEIEHMIHSGEIRISPAAGWYLRTYMIMPTSVTASGPNVGG